LLTVHFPVRSLTALRPFLTETACGVANWAAKFATRRGKRMKDHALLRGAALARLDFATYH